MASALTSLSTTCTLPAQAAASRRSPTARAGHACRRVVLPRIAIMFFAQRYLIAGLTGDAVKG